uniref:Uncharacterized protein n=1 Tax=viral metagenome TaxID=1070528 RepID=A0A6C0B553_9ZZZZ
MDGDLEISDLDNANTLDVQLGEQLEEEEMEAQQIAEQILLDEVNSDIDEEKEDTVEEEDSDDTTSDIEYIDDLDEDLEPIESTLKVNDIISVHETYSEYYTNTKITSPFLTKFERAKVLGIRAQMLASGAEPMISPPFPEECYDIALLELKAKKIPLIIRRYLPNKKFEDWRLEELIIKNV